MRSNCVPGSKTRNWSRTGRTGDRSYAGRAANKPGDCLLSDGTRDEIGEAVDSVDEAVSVFVFSEIGGTEAFRVGVEPLPLLEIVERDGLGVL
jgi:hypothetical protein